MPPSRRSAAKPADVPDTDAERAEPAADVAESYSGQAARLAEQVRAAVEEISETLGGLREQVDRVQQTEPAVAEARAADGVRRVPMAVGEVERALVGLRSAGVEVARRSAG